MRSPFDRLVGWLADRLGYVPAASLHAQVAANERLIEQLEDAERAEMRARADAEDLERQNARLQVLADAVLTARANSLKYGLPLDQALELEFNSERMLDRDLVVYRLSIRPKASTIQWAVTSQTMAELRDAPEVFARRVMKDLIPRFERSLGRALAGAAAAF
ncbi:hypothetical protein [Phenylobacterium sp.]|uniref:hypothetical protein n=1 Tax=Phenylobacterium sp. TaxID=1871053 RepID=UPI0039355DA9